MKKRIGLLVLAAGMLFSGLSQAAHVSLIEIPTRWRLENYLPDVVVAWFTGAKGCNQGNISLGPRASQSDRNRFWAAVSTAKANDKKMVVYYESADCTIVSFGLAEE